MEIRLAGVDDCQQLARLHALCFADAWGAEAFIALLDQPNTFALLANETQEEEACGFIVVRVAADESEILTLGVAPEHRSCGTASELVRAAAELAKSKGANGIFLEVGQKNSAAGNLYRKLGFEQVGMRRDYYRQKDAPGEDACILKAALPLVPPA